MKKTKKPESKAEVSPKAAPPYQNQVTLVGYLGDDPKLHEGRAMLSLATKSSWKPKDSDQWQEKTEWHRVIAWGKLAEAVKPLAKGDHVLVEGELRSYQYDKEVDVVASGKAVVQVKTWEIRASLVRKLVRKDKPEQAET